MKEFASLEILNLSLSLLAHGHRGKGQLCRADRKAVSGMACNT